MKQAPEIALKEATTEQIVNRLVLDMLQRFHSAGSRPELDARIEAVWQARRGVPFLPRSVTPTYLRGYPGQGKTTCYRVAAQEVAQLLDMAFVINPADDYVPTGHELMLVMQELSGQVSAVDFGGIPNVASYATPQGGEQPFMTKLASKRLASLQYAGAAVLLLDDFSNASPNIQNVALSILTENRFQGLNLGNTLVGATGNLGTSDGTHVSATSNAIVTRVANFLVVDTVDNWIARTGRDFPDSVGDAGIGGFLKRYPDLFHTPKRSRDGVPYPSPRSWSLFLPKLREIIYGYRARASDDVTAAFPYDELEFEAAGFLGLEAANKLAGYFLSFFQLSDPLARDLVRRGSWSEEGRDTFRKQYARGYAALSQQFGYQFVTALADYAAQGFMDALPEKSQWPHLARALAHGLYGERMDRALISYGAHYFALRVVLLAQSVEDLEHPLGTIDDKGRPTLHDDFLALLLDAIAAEPIASEVVAEGTGERPLRLLDETFCQVVSHFRSYG